VRDNQGRDATGQTLKKIKKKEEKKKKGRRKEEEEEEEEEEKEEEKKKTKNNITKDNKNPLPAEMPKIIRTANFVSIVIVWLCHTSSTV
jgi:CO dehydrogenase/acetyl-CoA synthase beta subunit